MKSWEIIADNQQNRLELGLIAAVDSQGRTIWIVEAHRDDGKHFIVHANEKVDGFPRSRICDLRLRRIGLTD